MRERFTLLCVRQNPLEARLRGGPIREQPAGGRRAALPDDDLTPFRYVHG